MTAYREKSLIFTETDRLYLRALEKDELPRLAALLDVWEVVRWMSVVPYPYTLRDANDFYNDMEKYYWQDDPQFYALALKSDNLLIGGVGLHPPRSVEVVEGELEIGYWLGQDYWGQGLATEAVRDVIATGFALPSTHAISATTAPNNTSSQNVLRKAGLRNTGTFPRSTAALRGSDTVMRWILTREAYVKVA